MHFKCSAWNIFLFWRIYKYVSNQTKCKYPFGIDLLKSNDIDPYIYLKAKFFLCVILFISLSFHFFSRMESIHLEINKIKRGRVTVANWLRERTNMTIKYYIVKLALYFSFYEYEFMDGSKFECMYSCVVCLSHWQSVFLAAAAFASFNHALSP